MIVGVEEGGILSEVVDFLTRVPRIQVVGTSADASSLARSVATTGLDAAVVSPGVARAADLDGAAILVVADRESTGALRAALAAGASGFFVWPHERDALAGAVARVARSRREPGARGHVAAVYGARGGSGVTFLATNLAGACRARGASSVVVDLDPFHGDVAAALGIPPNGHVPTIADLEPVLGEIAPEHLEPVLYEHPKGFRALFGPEEPGSVRLGAGDVSRLVGALRATFDVTVLHLPRALDDSVLAAIEASDEVFVAVTLDVLAFRDARRALAFLGSRGMADRCHLVLNRAARAEVSPDDAEHVFGMRPLSIIRVDRAVGRSQNRGELLTGRSGHAARRVSALAERLVGGAKGGAA